MSVQEKSIIKIGQNIIIENDGKDFNGWQKQKGMELLQN